MSTKNERAKSVGQDELEKSFDANAEYQTHLDRLLDPNAPATTEEDILKALGLLKKRRTANKKTLPVSKTNKPQ